MYTKTQILGKCSSALDDIKNFYKKDFVNYGGKTTDTGEYFTEVVAEFVIDHLNDFRNKIPMITRKTTYNTKSHYPININGNSNREEEIIAKKMALQSQNKPFDFIGNIIDYQTPLKNGLTDKAGKIDMLADDGKRLIILELKKPTSTESALRCVLEGYTYLKTADKTKLLKDFGKPESYGLTASPFVFKSSRQYNEFHEDRLQLKRLMELLDIKPYYISENDVKYFVTED